MNSRRALQVNLGVLGIIPIATGLVGFLGLGDPLYVHFGVVPNVVLDSNLRFFSGLWLGVGVTLYAILPRIEAHGVTYRALWGMIFLGGIGRLLSLLSAGRPPALHRARRTTSSRRARAEPAATPATSACPAHARAHERRLPARRDL